jgi:hypothetical protein
MNEIFGLLIERALAHTGRFAIWVATLGHCRAEYFEEREGQSYAPHSVFCFRRRGQCVVTVFGSMLAGIGFYVVLGLVIYLISN